MDGFGRYSTQNRGLRLDPILTFRMLSPGPFFCRLQAGKQATKLKENTNNTEIDQYSLSAKLKCDSRNNAPIAAVC